MDRVINLSKGEKVINLSKNLSSAKKARVELYWNVPGGCDLDLTMGFFDQNGNRVEFVSYERKTCQGGILYEDNLEGGRTNEPDEIIDIDFSKVSSNVKSIVIAFGIFSGINNFTQLKNVKCIVKDVESGKELVKIEDNGKVNATLLIVGRFDKNGTEWDFESVNEYVHSGYPRGYNWIRENKSIKAYEERYCLPVPGERRIEDREEHREEKKGFWSRLFG